MPIALVTLNKLRLSHVYIHVIKSIEILVSDIRPPDISSKPAPFRVEAFRTGLRHRTK